MGTKARAGSKGAIRVAQCWRGEGAGSCFWDAMLKSRGWVRREDLVALPSSPQLSLDARITCKPPNTITMHEERSDESKPSLFNVVRYMLSLFSCYTYYPPYPIVSYLCTCTSHIPVVSRSIQSTYAASASIFQNQQPLPLQPPQTIHIPAGFHNSLHRRLTQFPPLLGRLLLAARFRLATPAWRNACQDLAAIMRREVNEPDVRRTRLSWGRSARLPARGVEILMAGLMAESL